jgi:salicylate hydroxylase
MAIEDSAVLAKLFCHLISADQVPSFLYAFPELRQGRTKSTRVQEMGNIYFMALPNEAGAVQRDQHFRARRDKNLSPLEDESGDASSVWEMIKETWCYDAEDEADDWWVGWGMLRLRSQQTELEFGMELQVSVVGLQEIIPDLHLCQTTPMSLEVSVKS